MAAVARMGASMGLGCALVCSTLLGGCEEPGPGGGSRVKTTVQTACATALVGGRLLAPAALISDNAATLISDNAATYRVLGLAEIPVAAATVQLMTETGTASPPTLTTEKGEFSFPGLPCGKVVVVAAEFRKNGQAYQERAIVRSGTRSPDHDVSTATTIAASRILETHQIAALPRVDVDRMLALNNEVGAALTDAATASLASQAGSAAYFDALAQANPALTQGAALVVAPAPAPPAQGGGLTGGVGN